MTIETPEPEGRELTGTVATKRTHATDANREVLQVVVPDDGLRTIMAPRGKFHIGQTIHLWRSADGTLSWTR